MTLLNSRLQLALLNLKKGRNLLEKGFTLVELMIVIVIVGILSAVALPNFINQTLKAKGSEARSDNAAITKNAAAEYTDGGAKLLSELAKGGASAVTPDTSTYEFDAVANSCVGLGARSNDATQKFDYYCALEKADGTNTAAYAMGANTYTVGDYLLVVSAIGDSNDSGLSGRVVTHLLNLDNGHTQLVKTGTCKAFGGTLTSTTAGGKAPGTAGNINCT